MSISIKSRLANEHLLVQHITLALPCFAYTQELSKGNTYLCFVAIPGEGL